MDQDRAECGHLSAHLATLAGALERYQRFEHADAMREPARWRQALDREVPSAGVGIDTVLAEMGRHVIPNGSQIPNPGSSAFITTGATTIGALATLAGSVASPQRLGATAFAHLEEVALRWLVEMFELPRDFRGLFSSGGSTANLVALGGARQWAFERLGLDPARDGLRLPCRLYATASSHHTIRRAAAALGMGRSAVVLIDTDAMGRMRPDALRRRLAQDASGDEVRVAVVATAGMTSTGAIDPLRELGEIAREHGVWFHVDGAYGLPGILDPRVRPLYDGLHLADSVVVDPHKWLGAPVGIGATLVRDRSLLHRAFTQEPADYLEGSCLSGEVDHSMASLGVPYADFGVELSAPARGAVVWALIREIGVQGLRERVCRHNSMARHIAQRAQAHPRLELVQAPTLSICCFRYRAPAAIDANVLNKRIHHELLRRGRNLPSTAVINGVLAIRPCFVGARSQAEHADALVDEVIDVGDRLVTSFRGDLASAAPPMPMRIV
ncbi:aminotransferase class V-fold PLP-dependent enzyme [uncultured Piscinibacter sp.]|uniref:pyridoxal phosphate-dependent decarboxylase family protein n=1 Tax=uncultured Piscinibacter sp. TaxID=1131835 RepID=UPI002619E126|nr:aminotransferase class V-fold PLP-dependent enzyme [uncultured Piscinibacter sp.]